MTARSTQLLVRFLEGIGRDQDAAYYLELFRRRPKESFALVVGEPEVFRLTLHAVVEPLSFLSQLGLYPIVVLGLMGNGGPSSREVSEQLLRNGVDAAVVAGPRTPGELEGRRGELRKELRGERPVLLDLTALPPERRAGTLAELVHPLAPRKLVVLRSAGGLGPKVGGRLHLTPTHQLVTRAGGISVVNLTTDADALLHGAHLPADEAAVLEMIARFHGVMPSLLTSITSPLGILQELFTVKGAGTLVKTGSQLRSCDGYQDVDTARLAELVSETFGKPLRPDFFKEQPLRVYLEENYRGAAVVQRGLDASYLTKFAVTRQAQGEGIGRDLWEAVTRDHPKLYWRARHGNPALKWYASLCDGFQTLDAWLIYWRGVELDQVRPLIDECRKRPSDFL